MVSLTFSLRTRMLLRSCEVYKTLAGATFFAHRSFCAMKQKQQKFIAKAVQTRFVAQIAMETRASSAQTAEALRMLPSPRSWRNLGWPKNAVF